MIAVIAVIEATDANENGIAIVDRRVEMLEEMMVEADATIAETAICSKTEDGHRPEEGIEEMRIETAPAIATTSVRWNVRPSKRAQGHLHRRSKSRRQI